jgi:hypothetical protein
MAGYPPAGRLEELAAWEERAVSRLGKRTIQTLVGRAVVVAEGDPEAGLLLRQDWRRTPDLVLLLDIVATVLGWLETREESREP